MKANSQYRFLASMLIAVAWLSALGLGFTLAALVSAVASTALCAVMVVITMPRVHSLPPILLPPRSNDESSEFRRELFHLCAALKLSIDFCERHRDSEPDALIGEVEEMRDGICAFINRAARPVRFLSRLACAADRSRPRSPRL
jgi:hypothetical protein